MSGTINIMAAEKKYDSEESGAVDVQEGIVIDDGLRRALLGRHVSLISLASIIGAGSFYGFGYALYLSGPLGALIGFGIVGQSILPLALLSINLTAVAGY